MKHRHIGAIVVLLLAGCASLAPEPAAVPTDPPGHRPLAPPAAVGDRAIGQIVQGAVGARELTLNCVISVKGDELSVVGLNAMGVRLFTIRYDGKQVSAAQSLAVPGQLTPERLLADLQLVYWPLASLEAPLGRAGYSLSEPSPGTRRLRRGEQLVAEVHFAGADPWGGRSWLVNLEHGYSLQIDSRSL